MSDSYRCREFRPDELGGFRALVARNTEARTSHLRDHLAAPERSGRWFFAAIKEGGPVGAIAAVEGTRAQLFGEDDGAIEAMARAMLKSQQLHTSREAHRHVLFGPAAVVDTFWKIFRDVGRQVVGDRTLALMKSAGEGKGSRRVAVHRADDTDLPLLTAFFGDFTLEREGHDPRRSGSAAFDGWLQTEVAEGRVLVGREGERAMFAACVHQTDEGNVTLQPVHVPIAYRSRKLLVGGALHACRHTALCDGQSVEYFADGELMEIAGDRAGFSSVARFREIAMLG